MADHKAAATNFLNALERIPKLIEQYKTQNMALELDLPTLQEVVSGTWKKEDELKQLKSEVAALERKIQLTLQPSQQEQQAVENSNAKIQEVVSPPISTVNNLLVNTRCTSVENRDSRRMKL